MSDKIYVIEKRSPAATGNTERDIRALEDHLVYMQEQLNYILQRIQRRNGSGE